MSKVLFINGNLHGHINPTLPIVKELVKRGEEVYYFSTKDFQSKLEAYGAVFLDYGKEFETFIQNFRPHGDHPFYTLMEYMLGFDRAIVPIVLAKSEVIKFDYLIHDVMFGAGTILARKLDIPAISSCSSFVMEKPPLPAHMLERGSHPQLDYLYEEIKKAKKEWKIPSLDLSDIFFKKEPLVLVYSSRLFHPQNENLDSTYRFIGPSVMERNEVIDFPLNSSKASKLIYISLGTINNRHSEFYQKCFDAFSDGNYKVILSVGSKTEIPSLGKLPDNFIVRNYVPQLEILKLADVFISHGGLNSVSEAFYYGVPVIVIPIANDQPAVAKRIVELGAGVALNMESITTIQLKDAVNKILSNQSFTDCSRKIGESFINAGGYVKAVNEIIDYLVKGMVSCLLL